MRSYRELFQMLYIVVAAIGLTGSALSFWVAIKEDPDASNGEVVLSQAAAEEDEPRGGPMELAGKDADSQESEANAASQSEGAGASGQNVHPPPKTEVQTEGVQ